MITPNHCFKIWESDKDAEIEIIVDRENFVLWQKDADICCKISKTTELSAKFLSLPTLKISKALFYSGMQYSGSRSQIHTLIAFLNTYFKLENKVAFVIMQSASASAIIGETDKAIAFLNALIAYYEAYNLPGKFLKIA